MFIVRFASRKDELTELFKKLDVDGNGTIDFDEFKAGAKKEPLLVKAFLAPVQQGSLATAPAAARKTKAGAGAGAGPAAASRETARTSETTAEAQGEGETTSANVSASPDDSSSCSPGAASAATAVETPGAAASESLGSWSEVLAPKDGRVGCDDDVDGRDSLSAKRSRVEGSDGEEGNRP